MYNWFRRLFARTPMNKGHTDMTTTQGLVCKEVVELITDYLEGALLPEKRAQLEEHVAGCPGCRNYIEQVRLTIVMLHNLAQEPVFPETKEDLLEVFRRWKKS
jgi:predicted anti-sigma-YlaC factor YlaD